MITTRDEFKSWASGFIKDLTKDFDLPYVQELLSIYLNDLVHMLGRSKSVITFDELCQWRMIGKILRLEMFIYCPEEYKFPGIEECADINDWE